MTAAEQVRSFIAIELPDEVKAGLARLQARLRTGNQSAVKWVDPYSTHLTLKFLGNINAARVNEITGVMEASARDIPPFSLTVKGMGVFPGLRRVRVVWVGLTGDLETLGQLRQRLETNLAPLGFTPEARTFTPHLTLARVREQATPEEVQSFGQLVAGTEFETAFDFKVDSINLMKSQITREGAVYSRLSSVRLGKPLSNTD